MYIANCEKAEERLKTLRSGLIASRDLSRCSFIFFSCRTASLIGKVDQNRENRVTLLVVRRCFDKIVYQMNRITYCLRFCFFFSEKSSTMMKLTKKLEFLYPTYVLAIVSIGYICGELGHYLIGVTSRAVAEDLHYGDISCQLNLTDVHLSDLPIQCNTANDSETCSSYKLNGTPYCEWNYNGLGLDYQILAGPSFIAVFTIAGIVMGLLADKFNRC
nr:unnamed protein product [Callosobruchus chinensis]